MPEASICIASHKRPDHLFRTLKSINDQPFRNECEVIVVEDSDEGETSMGICNQFGVDRFIHLNRTGWRNPPVAWNAAFKMASAETLVIQQADVMHARSDTIFRLVRERAEGEALIARVDEWNPWSNRVFANIMSPERGWWAFFLGSVSRKDVYRVGGMDEEFTQGAHDDVWFSECLEAAGVIPRKVWHIAGLHQSHKRHSSKAISRAKARSKRLLNRKRASGCYFSSGGPWRMP